MLTYEQMLSQATANYRASLDDARELTSYVIGAEPEEATVILEIATDIQIEARAKLREDGRDAMRELQRQANG